MPIGSSKGMVAVCGVDRHAITPLQTIEPFLAYFENLRGWQQKIEWAAG